ncbi:hypothetical protein So717_02300 [Roseobacter cerasinus]|uniref:Uncharacterized protein n=1 Tax=Roseobacter cerasinus TaxID=2602289 RepID=A0A640VL47_9RHOB|nr:hypothetical protein [Roseobacter cerasinus]GFE48477.1 hypothetical protein So717_02300 [Roseobacter cerasinus]
MSDLKFLITNGFLEALEKAGKLAPRAASRAKVRIFKLKRYLDAVEHSWRTPDHLRWSHVAEAQHVKSAYPPPEFGAFLANLEKPVLFQSIDGLDDPDAEGYFARFRARKFDLACVVLYTEQPKRRLAFLSVGSLADCTRSLDDLQNAVAARKVIAELRAVTRD